MLASTLLFFLGTTPECIILSRIIQGISTTIVWVAGMSLMVSRISEEDFGKCVGYTSVGLAIGDVTGPLLGGPFYDMFGHWAVFGMVEGLLALDIIFRLFILEDKGPETTKSQGGQRDAETDSLIQQGSSPTPAYDATGERNESTQPTHASGKKPDALKSLANLAWNWLGTEAALAAVFLVRGALEVVCCALNPYREGITHSNT